MNLRKKFYSDAGHGWLAVKRKDLDDLGIAWDISQFSHEKGKSVYLEEDCDAPKFMSACKDRGLAIEIEEMPSVDRSPIRAYASYEKPTGASIYEIDPKDRKVIERRTKELGIADREDRVRSYVRGWNMVKNGRGYTQ